MLKGNMRKDPSLPTSITLTFCDDSIIFKDALGKTRISSIDDDKKIAKIIREIAKDENLPELDIHHLKITDNNVEGNPQSATSGPGFPSDIDFTDMDAVKREGLKFLVNNWGNFTSFKRGNMGKGK